MSDDPALMNPITGIDRCCARAVSGHAAAPPSTATNCRLPMLVAIDRPDPRHCPLQCRQEYHAPIGRSGSSRRLPRCGGLVANGGEAVRAIIVNRSLVTHLYGPAARCKPKMMIWRTLVLRFCIRPIDGAFKLLAIMDIRARSISFASRPRRPYGSPRWRDLFSISSFQLADLGGKPTLASGISLSRQPSPW